MREKKRISRQLLILWYRLRQKRGHPRFSGKRLWKLSLLYPEKNPERTAEEQDEKSLRCLLAGGALLLLLSLAVLLLPGEGELLENRLRRPEPGESSRFEGLNVEAGGQNWETELEIHERKQTAEEQEAVLDQAEIAMLCQLVGENPSLDEVSLPLNLSSTCSIDGVEAFWEPCEPRLIHWDGSLTTEVVFGEGRETLVKLHLRFGERERIREVSVTLVDPEPAEITWEDQLERALAEAEEKEPEQEYVLLPQVINGQEVIYRTDSGGGNGFLILLGFVALLALPLLQEQKRKEAFKQREEELALSYSELAAKLTVLVGAGLTVRSAWERMVEDYEQDLEKGGKRRILYEEMRRTRHALTGGTREEQAYSEFGRRCGQAAYLRLGGLLESHLRNGTKGLGDILRAESSEAFRERLTLAKRQGEQMNAKLLLPLLLLFALVLVLLVLPAFLGFLT